MDKLYTKTVDQLQSELRERGLPVTGLKDDLIQRLLVAYDSHETSLEVEDSIPLGKSAASDISSLVSNTSSQRVKATARRVSLEVEEKALKIKQEIKFKKLSLEKEAVELKLKEEKVDLQIKMDQARAEEQVYLEAESREFTQPPQSTVLEMLINNQKLLQLPNQEPMTFDGNCLDYPSFIQSFETLIATKTDDDRAKLHFLYKYTVGAPHDLIKGFLAKPDQDSYLKARQMLKQRYGHPYRISESYRQALEKWKEVRTSDQLLKLADFMQQCEVAMGTVKYLDDLNSTPLLRIVVGKLPYHARIKWCKTAYSLRKQYEKEVTFQDLTRFVAEEAEIANDPLFAPDLFKNENFKIGSKFKSSEKNLVSFQTEAKLRPFQTEEKLRPFTPICIYCKKMQKSNDEFQHDISDCKLFIKKKWSERVEFLKEESACFGCGSIGKHKVAECRRRKECKICQKQHLTSMHRESKDDVLSATAKCTEVCGNCVDSGMDNCLIVPMWVRNDSAPGKEIMVYGVVDPQSNQCFVSEDLCQEFNVEGMSTQLLLSTMQEEDFMVESQKVKGFEISDRHRQNPIPLNSVFTRKAIPVKSSQIPKPETAKQWNHLKSLE